MLELRPCITNCRTKREISFIFVMQRPNLTACQLACVLNQSNIFSIFCCTDERNIDERKKEIYI